MASTFAGGTLRVTTPASYDATAAPRGRALPGEVAAGRDVLVAALTDSELELVESVDLTPRTPGRTPGTNRELGAEAAARTGTVELEVDVPAGQDAVVLMERDGVYSWHLPVNRAERTRALEARPRTARFEIAVQAAPPPGHAAGRTRPRRSEAEEAEEDRTRGLLGSLVQGAAQALVFRFVAPVLAKKAIDAMEDHVRPGLVHLTDTDVEGWRRVETLAEVGLPGDRPVRVLLLVHGTFSSTAGAFGAWSVEENGQGFLRTAISAYDAVIGFDHKTLSLDPRQNAEDLLERLRPYGSGEDLVIDVVCHSRGGLVARSFVEAVLPRSGWPASVEVMVFVAATNGGTHLADPERWSDLVDLYTNLATVGAHALVLLGAGPAAAVVGGVVRGIAALVKYLVSYAAEGEDVPGLKAMVPGGAFVKDLNKVQEGQPRPGTSWYVVSSNFHVELFDDHHNPPEFPRELARRLGEGFVDRLFEGDNDLVVDTASMAAIGGRDGGFVREQLALGENDTVYHTNYFGQLRVIEAIAGWLPLGMGAGGGEEALAPEPDQGPPVAPPTRSFHPPSEREAGPAGAPPPGQPTTGAEPPTEPTAEPVTGAEPPAELTEANLAAEMPAEVVEDQEFDVRVRLSRRELQAGAGTAHEERTIEVDADRPLNVEVVGKTNATIVGTSSDVFDLPSGGGTSELVFTGRALAPGAVVVTVVVRQGTVVNATLTLTSSAVEKGAKATSDAATAPVVTAESHTGVDAPELEGLPCLDIVERQLPDGAVVFHYAVRLLEGEEPVFFESRPFRDRQARIAAVLDDVAELWRNTEDDPHERERKLQDIGATLFDELFPEDMQAYLWKHRAKVKDLILYADEPFVPWELVHLKPPHGPRPEKPRFLAQSGLVRWQLGSFPPREMRVRAGRARSLCPAYLDPRFALTEPAQEERFLAEQLGAEPVTATPARVRELLRSGGFDLFHFSGHGAAASDDILDAKLLLKGRKRGKEVEPQYLGATTVSENAKWAAAHEAGPVVVLNACQVGRAGLLLSTVGGFAKAFLDAGASAFVSCLWSVRQEPSRVFVERLYEELLAGTPMATASARAREETRKSGDATWLAFVVYARPDAVLVRS